MALSDFMPYGAPELLEGAAARLARSTAIGTLAVAALVFALGALTSRGLSPLHVMPEDARRYDLITEVVLHDLLAPAAPRATPLHTPLSPNALVRAVPDPPEPQAPVGEWSPTPPGLPGPGAEPGDIESPPGRGLLAPSADPLPGEYVETDEYPALVRCSEALYPELARAAGVEGTVRVLILVEPDGRVRRAQVSSGGSVPLLDEAAIAAARTCVFTPALRGGHPVKVWVLRSYRFSLR